MCTDTHFSGLPAGQQGGMRVKAHGWVQRHPSQWLPHSLWDFLYWISQDAAIVNGPILLIHKKANETPYSVITACPGSEDSKMDKTISWKNVNMLGYIIQIITLKQLYDIIELHSLELPGLLFSVQMMLGCTSRLVPPSSNRRKWTRQEQKIRGTQK